MLSTRNIAALGLFLAATATDAQVHSLAELRALPAEVVASRAPVEVEATTIYSDFTTGAVILHDGTAASYAVIWGNPWPKLGDRVRLSGHSETSGYLPHLSTTRLEIIGRSDLPPHYLCSSVITDRLAL